MNLHEGDRQISWLQGLIFLVDIVSKIYLKVDQKSAGV